MPLIAPSASSLPYFDPPSTAGALAAADALIQAELAPHHETTLHTSIPPAHDPAFSHLISTELERIASGAPKSIAVDLTRYEALDAPADGALETWKSVLQQAYTSTEYLRSREINLGLLETYGKNAWLIGNSQLENVLHDLEREVEGAKLELEEIEQARRTAQEEVMGEVKGLEEGWRSGVGRMIETQAAAEGQRSQILKARRQAAR